MYRHTIEKNVALSIHKPSNAVTVMLAVMQIIQKTLNAAPVMPVKMYQTILKHNKFRCYCVFLSQISTF